jgi:signal transduction histidine kinase
MLNSQESQARLRLLTRTARALTNHMAIEPILELVLSSACEVAQARTSTIIMKRDDRTLQALFQQRAGLHSLAEHANRPLDERLAAHLEEIFGTHYLAVPLITGGQVIGVLATDSAVSESDAGELEWFLSALADNASVALKQAYDAKDAAAALHENFDTVPGSQSSRQMMMSALAHDLYSPLRTINIGCDLLERGMGKPTDDQREILDHIRISTRHLDALATNLVEMGRLNAGVANIVKVRCCVKRISDEATAIVMPDIHLRKQELIQKVDTCDIEGDPDRLRQVLINLLGNACKYSPAGSTVHLFSEETDGSIQVHVKDNGPGIPPEQQEAVFRPYYRWTSGEMPGSSGVGLGLAISRQLMRKMNGELLLHSTVGEGSTFSIILPGLCED